MIATIIGTIIIYSLATIIKDIRTVKRREKWQRAWDDHKKYLGNEVSEWDVTESYLTFCHEMIKEGLGKYVPSF